MRCRAITRSPRRLRAYIDAAGIAEDRKGWLFRTAAAMTAASSPTSPWASRTPGG